MVEKRDFSKLRERLLDEEQRLIQEIEHLEAALKNGEVEVEMD